MLLGDPVDHVSHVELDMGLLRVSRAEVLRKIDDMLRLGGEGGHRLINDGVHFGSGIPREGGRAERPDGRILARAGQLLQHHVGRSVCGSGRNVVNDLDGGIEPVRREAESRRRGGVIERNHAGIPPRMRHAAGVHVRIRRHGEGSLPEGGGVGIPREVEAGHVAHEEKLVRLAPGHLLEMTVGGSLHERAVVGAVNGVVVGLDGLHVASELRAGLRRGGIDDLGGDDLPPRIDGDAQKPGRLGADIEIDKLIPTVG